MQNERQIERMVRKRKRIPLVFRNHRREVIGVDFESGWIQTRTRYTRRKIWVYYGDCETVWLDFDAVFEGILTPRRPKAYNRWRKQAIKAYGNAVVPQVVLQIFETINEYEALSRAERSGK